MAVPYLPPEDIRDFFKDGLDEIAEWVVKRAKEGDGHRELVGLMVVMYRAADLFVETTRRNGKDDSTVRRQDDQSRVSRTVALPEQSDQTNHLRAG
jgi:hypothetical protein